MRWITSCAAVSLIAVFTGGCVLNDKNDSGTTKEPDSISKLTMGGGVFFLEKEGYAFAEFGTFNGIYPYEKAKVFVNGIELKNNAGIFTNTNPITPAQIKNGKPVRIAVYALNDSVVHEIELPQTPVIVSPAANAQLTAGKDLTISISYPGNHRVISMALTGQDNVAMAVETASETYTLPVPGSRLPNAGECILTAMSTNISGPIPQNIDLNKQYSIFTVNTLAVNPVTFTK